MLDSRVAIPNRVELEAGFATRMRTAIGAPCVVVLPYALYIYYGLDRTNGSLSSFLALLVALGSAAFVLGSAVGSINAVATVRASRGRWFRDSPRSRQAATIGACAFFLTLALAVVYEQVVLGGIALVVPAAAAAAWLVRAIHTRPWPK